MNKYGDAVDSLVQTLGLAYKPVGIRITTDEREIPENCFRPFRDKNEKYAFCQTMTMGADADIRTIGFDHLHHPIGIFGLDRPGIDQRLNGHPDSVLPPGKAFADQKMLFFIKVLQQ